MKIKDAKDLDQLLSFINIAEEYKGKFFDEDGVFGFSDFPTFGGEDPSNTDGVFSWDATRLLVETQVGFEIVNRDDWRS